MLPLGHSLGILIPQKAVATVGQLTMVNVAADKTAQLRQAELGRQIGDQVEVLAWAQVWGSDQGTGIARGRSVRPSVF